MNLSFLADENISRYLVTLLREQGYHVSWIRELKKGTSDLSIIEMAAKEDLIIITNDKDFGYLIFKQRLKCPGLILIRIDEIGQGNVILAILQKYRHKLKNHFTIITDKKVRFRPL
jgi:predicted nuclease of predicted toxin-antitoxin system